MSTNAAELDATQYKNGQKNNWRQGMWNQLRSMTRHPNDALILYLPGAANLDVEVARRKGFDVRNMIAVERDRSVAQYLRRQYKQTVIDADLTQVLLSWPENHPVKIVIADLVHGLTTDVYPLFEAWAVNRAFRRCHLVVNMLRGRETDNLFVGLEKDWFLTAAAATGLPPKSRTLHGLLAFNFVIARVLTRNIPEGERIHNLGKVWEWLITTPAQRNVYVAMALPSYRSPSRQTFDSFLIHDRDNWKSIFGTERAGFPEIVQAKTEQELEQLRAINRRITAAMAVRTMRMNGKLPVHP